jgi:hypothetical protein
MAKHESRAARSSQPSHQPATAGQHSDETGIAVLAYQLWMDRGCPIGSDQEDWFRAEAIIKGAEQGEVEPQQRRMAGGASL